MDNNCNKFVKIFYKRQYKIYKYLGLFNLPDYCSSTLHSAYNVYFWHVALFWMVLFDLSMCIQVISTINDFNEIIRVVYLFSSALAVMAKFIWIKTKNHSYVQLFQLMHTEEFLPVNPYETDKFKESVKLSQFVRNCYQNLSLTALTLIFVTQLIDDWTALPLSIYIPFNVDNLWIFIMVFIYQLFALSLCCIMNIAFDSLGSSFFIYLKGQLDMLTNRLEKIGKNEKDSQELINYQLKDCMRYYARIVNVTEMMEELISVPMSVQVMSSIVVLVANFYAMTFLSGAGDITILLKYVVYQICMLSQIFILCYYANEVSLKSLELSHALYSSEWVGLSKENRRLILLMMIQFDTPIRIKTVNGCYSFNLAAFTSIVNSSYSYFALLKKMNS